MENRLNKNKFFYGWIIVGAGFIIMATAMGIVFNSSSLFIKPVSVEFGLSRSQINFTSTIRALCKMVVAFFSGMIFTKYKMKRIMKISAIVLPLSYFSYSFSNSVLTYYAITFIVSISSVLLTVLPLSFIIGNWFYERQGFALGIAFMGSGIGGMVFNFLTGLWITSYGWRVSYQILAAIMFITLIPCVFFLIQVYPRDMGLSALGKIEEDSSKGHKDEEKGILLSQAVKTPNFWAILLCALLVSMSIDTLIYNIAPHLTDIGYSTRLAANVVAMSMGTLAIFKVVLGQLYDKLGLRKATIIACMSVILGLMGLIFANYYLAFILIIMGTGLGCSYATMANPIITQKIFGRRDYNSIYGIIIAMMGLGGIISPMMMGYIFDRTGSYNLAFKIMIGFSLIAIIIYSIIFTKPVKTRDK